MEFHIDSKILSKESCLNNDSKTASTGSSSSDMAICDDKIIRKSKAKKRLSGFEQFWKHKVPEYSKNKPREKTYENNLKKMKEETSKLTPLEIPV